MQTDAHKDGEREEEEREREKERERERDIDLISIVKTIRAQQASMRE